MKKTNLLSFITLLLFTFLACNKNSSQKELCSQQKILFQYEFTNFAWGYQHTGWFIDTAGCIYSYSLPENWNYTDSSGTISSLAMEQNLSKAYAIAYAIDKIDLNKKIELLYKASVGTISEPKQEIFDAGYVIFTGYIFNKNLASYKPILLKQTGDFRIENDSKAAEDLYNWLLSINYIINS